MMEIMLLKWSKSVCSVEKNVSLIEFGGGRLERRKEGRTIRGRRESSGQEETIGRTILSKMRSYVDASSREGNFVARPCDWH